jgi:hypothetical protein
MGPVSAYDPHVQSPVLEVFGQGLEVTAQFLKVPSKEHRTRKGLCIELTQDPNDEARTAAYRDANADATKVFVN